MLGIKAHSSNRNLSFDDLSQFLLANPAWPNTPMHIPMISFSMQVIHIEEQLMSLTSGTIPFPHLLCDPDHHAQTRQYI